jgi:hypothetical protein
MYVTFTPFSLIFNATVSAVLVNIMVGKRYDIGLPSNIRLFGGEYTPFLRM